jgi:tripartite-type tricarboxylate transporter receptor subunit TctC
VRGWLRRTAVFGLAMSWAALASAQDYPSRPITIVVPWAAGGPTDVVTRILGQAMSTDLKQPVVVENLGGASGTVGAARAARATPDGYTLFLHNISHATAPSLYKSLPYDPVEDFEPIGLILDVPQAVVSKNALPAKTLPELVAYLKANRDKVNLAQAGRGSGSHLCALLFMSAIDTKLTEVAYKGTGPAITDLMGGQVDVMCDQVSNTGNQIKAGTIRGYCTTIKSQVASLPDVRPCTEAGLPGFDASVWHGLYAPKGTPKPVLDRVNVALRAALRDGTVKARLAELGAVPVAETDVTPSALRSHLKAQVEKWATVIRAAKLQPE